MYVIFNVDGRATGNFLVILTCKKTNLSVLFKQVYAGIEMPHIAMARADLLEMDAIIGKEYNNQSHYTTCPHRSTE